MPFRWSSASPCPPPAAHRVQVPQEIEQDGLSVGRDLEVDLRAFTHVEGDGSRRRDAEAVAGGLLFRAGRRLTGNGRLSDEEENRGSREGSRGRPIQGLQEDDSIEGKTPLGTWQTEPRRDRLISTSTAMAEQCGVGLLPRDRLGRAGCTPKPAPGLSPSRPILELRVIADLLASQQGQIVRTPETRARVDRFIESTSGRCPGSVGAGEMDWRESSATW